MVFCEYCDSKFDEDISVCPNCGATLLKVQEEEKQQEETPQEETMSQGNLDQDEDDDIELAKTILTTLGGALFEGLIRSSRRPPVAPRDRRPPTPRGDMMGSPMRESSSRSMGGGPRMGRPSRPIGGGPRMGRPSRPTGGGPRMGGPGGRPRRK